MAMRTRRGHARHLADQQLGVPVDTIALQGRPQPLLKTEAVGIPGAVFAGERFPVDLTIYAPRAVAATVELSAEGKPLGTSKVSLEAGENRVRIRTSLNASGAIDLSGRSPPQASANRVSKMRWPCAVPACSGFPKILRVPKVTSWTY